MNRRVGAMIRRFDDVILSTGIVRAPGDPGIEHARVAAMSDVEGRKVRARRALVGGAASASRGDPHAASRPTAPERRRADDPAIAAFRDEWGIDREYARRGGLKPSREDSSPRKLWLLQRKTAKVGEGLAKTTGWIRRTLLRRRGVTMLSGVEYVKIDDAGLHIVVDGKPQVLDVDTVVICAGQEPRRELVAGLEAAGIVPKLIGGADVALELDAKRAIDQGTRVALSL